MSCIKAEVLERVALRGSKKCRGWKRRRTGTKRMSTWMHSTQGRLLKLSSFIMAAAYEPPLPCYKAKDDSFSSPHKQKTAKPRWKFSLARITISRPRCLALAEMPRDADHSPGFANWLADDVLWHMHLPAPPASLELAGYRNRA
jgi:hypothetical protein